MGEWKDLERVEGAQLHLEMWAQQHMKDMAAHRFGTWTRCGETKLQTDAHRMVFSYLTYKNIKNLQTKEEDKEAKVEAKKEKLPEKLQPAFKKDQVTYKPLI